MCGIFGFVTPDPQRLPAELAQRIDRRLAHRGPDDRGWLSLRGATLERGRELTEVTAAGAYLLHRRLAILDLSDAAHQPMSSPDGRHHLAFNGEIYNYRELRAELERAGHRFASDGDTAVLLAALAEWGEAALARLVGMFAFALLDLRERTLLLARDPLGIKPLYHARWRGGLAFASEVAPLLELPGVGRTVDAERAYGYLRYAESGSGERTFFADVRQLRAGHLIRVPLDNPGHATPQRYWKLVPDADHTLSFDEAATRLRELFTDSVSLHTRSDVPFGVTLSGGIDSSAIACAVRDRIGGELRTFSYVAQSPERSERGWAELVAGAIGARATRFTVRPEDLATDFDRLLDAYQEPGSTATNYLQLRLAACARETGTKVVLSGQGADEILAGYQLYLTARLASLVRGRRFAQAARMLWLLRRRRQVWRFHTVLTRDAMLAPAWLERSRLRAHNRTMPPWLDGRWFRERGVDPSPPLPRHGADALRDRLIASTVETSLPELLWGEDRGSMHHSVELRVPFVTPALVTFVLGLPEEYLVDERGTRKAVFREAMRGLVPDRVLDRRFKLGLAMSPLEREFDVAPWLNGSVRPHGPVRPGRLAADRERALSHQDEFELARLWRVATFSRWAERFEVPLA
jgi:asparagine synthase (glutamine-hydrolysing)